MEFKEDFAKIEWLLPKKYIELSIELVLGATPMSKMLYSMSTPELKESQCK